MAEKLPELNVEITAKNDTQAAIDQIKKELSDLVRGAERVTHATEHMAHHHGFAEITEHVDLLKEHFGGLRGSIGEVSSSVTELLPALAALSAAGSLVSLFETTEHVAEAYGELSHTAASLGMEVQQLHLLRGVAELTDTSVEGMGKSIGKLNKVLGETVAGKNKDVAALFKHMRIDPRSFKDGADALPTLADAFKLTTDATVRARMAVALFGKSGMDMIPLLMKGGDALRESMKEVAKVSIDFKPYSEGLEKYHESQVMLTLATQGFVDLLGGKLAPVLRPIIDEATDFVVANREWITGDIADGVGEFSDYLKALPWQQVGDDIREAKDDVADFVTAIGGPKVAIDTLAGVMALKGVLFLAEPIKDAAKLASAVGGLITKVGTELVEAWGLAGGAAESAGAKELIAAEVGIPGVAGGKGALHAAETAEELAVKKGWVPTLTAGLASGLASAGAFVADAVPLFGGGLIGAHIADPNREIDAQQDRDPSRAYLDDLAFRHSHGWFGNSYAYQKKVRLREQYHAEDADHVYTPDLIDAIRLDLSHTHDLVRPLDYLPPSLPARPGDPAPTYFSPLPSFYPSGVPMLLPSAPSMNTPSSQQQNAKTDIHVTFDGLPQGSRVETTTSGPVGNVKTDIGQAWMEFHQF